jgi:hypothetical protein
MGREGKGRKGKERKGKERKGKERKGKERKGKERKGKERKGCLLLSFNNSLGLLISSTDFVLGVNSRGLVI